MIQGHNVGIETIRAHLVIESKTANLDANLKTQEASKQSFAVEEETDSNVHDTRNRELDGCGSETKQRRLRKEAHSGKKDPILLLSIDGNVLPQPLRIRSRSHSPYTRIIREMNDKKFEPSISAIFHSPSNTVKGKCEGTQQPDCSCCKVWKSQIENRIVPQRSISGTTAESEMRTHKGAGNSDYEPSKAPTVSTQPSLPKMDTDEERRWKSSDEEDLKKYFLVQGQKILDLVTSCPKCHSQLSKEDSVRLTHIGTAPIVRVACSHCWTKSRPEQSWEGQERSLESTSDRSFAGNTALVTSVITTGMRWTNLLRFSHQLGLRMVSSSAFYRQAKLVREAVDLVHTEKESIWLKEVKKAYEEAGLQDDGWQLAMDGAYDSRGYTANIGKVVTADQVTNLVIGISTIHRSETDNISTRMENEGIRRQIKLFHDKGITIRSITTDRSRSAGKTIEAANKELNLDIKHFYDGWHIVKWIGNELRKQSKYANCGQILLWMQPVKTHAWNAIEMGQQTGNVENIRYILNSCIHHVRGEHKWNSNPDVTGSLIACSHAPLPEREFDIIPGSNADTRLCSVIMNKKIQEDIVKANIKGTSICEVKNALDRLYCPKELWIPISTYPSAAKMSQLHLNELTMAEREGRRVVIKQYDIQRKFLTRKTKMKKKTTIEHAWRHEVHKHVLAIMTLNQETKFKERRMRAAKKNMLEIQSDDEDMDAAEQDQDDEFRDDDDDMIDFNHRDHIDALDSLDEKDEYDSDEAPLGFVQGIINGHYEKKQYKSYLSSRGRRRSSSSSDDEDAPLSRFVSN